MTTTERRLLQFANLVNEFAKAEGNEIVRSALNDKMATESFNIIQEFSDKEKNDGRKKQKDL
jgi:hypothetical protein